MKLQIVRGIATEDKHMIEEILGSITKILVDHHEEIIELANEVAALTEELEALKKAKRGTRQASNS